MLLKTRCIIIKQIKYNDNSFIVHAFTREKGKAVFFVRTSKKASSSLKRNLFQPLSILEIEARIRNNNDIQHITEASLSPPLDSIPYHPHKNAIALFISEILFLCLKEEASSHETFDFIEASILYFDVNEENINDFHLIFLIKLMRYLGFSPTIPKNNECYFDFSNGGFSNSKPIGTQFLEKDETLAFINCLNNPIGEIPDLSKNRSILLEKILNYYKIHLLSEKDPKSLGVLQEVFFRG